MYHKVIILEIKDRYALAMTEEGEIIRIKKKAGMKVGAAVYVLEEDKYEKVRTLHWQKAAAIAAAILLCITSLLLPQFSQQVYAMVELEGAKSVSVKVDKNYKIQDAYSYDDTVSLKALKDLEGKNLRELKDFAEQLRASDGSLNVVYALYKKVSEEFAKVLQEIFGSESVTYMEGKIEEIQEPDKKQKTDIITGKEIIAEPKETEEEDDREDAEADIEDADEPENEENEEDDSFSEEDEPDNGEQDIEPETEEPEEPEITERENQKPETLEQENQEPEDIEEEETEDEED